MTGIDITTLGAVTAQSVTPGFNIQSDWEYVLIPSLLVLGLLFLCTDTRKAFSNTTLGDGIKIAIFLLFLIGLPVWVLYSINVKVFNEQQQCTDKGGAWTVYENSYDHYCIKDGQVIDTYISPTFEAKVDFKDMSKSSITINK